MNSGKSCHHVCRLTDSHRHRSCTLVSHIRHPDSLCPFKLREDVPENEKCDADLEDDDSVSDMVHKVSVLDAQQILLRWVTGSSGAVARARRMCALSLNFQPQAVDTPDSDTKWTQPLCVAKLAMLPHTASSPAELSNLKNLRSKDVHSSVLLP